jgi:hypothetical protein
MTIFEFGSTTPARNPKRSDIFLPVGTINIQQNTIAKKFG